MQYRCVNQVDHTGNDLFVMLMPTPCLADQVLQCRLQHLHCWLAVCAWLLVAAM